MIGSALMTVMLSTTIGCVPPKPIAEGECFATVYDGDAVTTQQCSWDGYEWICKAGGTFGNYRCVRGWHSMPRDGV